MLTTFTVPVPKLVFFLGNFVGRGFGGAQVVGPGQPAVCRDAADSGHREHGSGPVPAVDCAVRTDRRPWPAIFCFYIGVACFRMNSSLYDIQSDIQRLAVQEDQLHTAQHQGYVQQQPRPMMQFHQVPVSQYNVAVQPYHNQGEKVTTF